MTPLAMANAQQCQVCASADLQIQLSLAGYNIARCQACHTLQVVPMPSPEFLKAHYADPSYFEGDASQGYSSYAAMHQALRPHFLHRLARLERLRPGRGRLLDVGCADGYFLELARVRGWQVSGVELSHAMARRAERTLGIAIAPSVDALPPESSFDAITAWEVIEHLSDPVHQLVQLKAHLAEGGWLMLSTPNTGHWQAQREPYEWTGYRPPSHLFFYTRRTLDRVLLQSGFESIDITGTLPLPPLPIWLRRVSAPLQRSLATGQARPWFVARTGWRAIRLAGWGWQRLRRPGDDVFTTLEVAASPYHITAEHVDRRAHADSRAT